MFCEIMKHFQSLLLLSLIYFYIKDLIRLEITKRKGMRLEFKMNIFEAATV